MHLNQIGALIERNTLIFLLLLMGLNISLFVYHLHIFEKLNKLREAGINPFPNKFDPTYKSKSIKTDFDAMEGVFWRSYLMRFYVLDF